MNVNSLGVRARDISDTEDIHSEYGSDIGSEASLSLNGMDSQSIRGRLRSGSNATKRKNYAKFEVQMEIMRNSELRRKSVALVTAEFIGYVQKMVQSKQCDKIFHK